MDDGQIQLSESTGCKKEESRRYRRTTRIVAPLPVCATAVTIRMRISHRFLERHCAFVRALERTLLLYKFHVQLPEPDFNQQVSYLGANVADANHVRRFWDPYSR